MRGAGSLQQLLGKSTFSNGNRKRKNTQDANNSRKASAEEDAGPAETTTTRTTTPAATVPLVESPIKAGHVRCPVCQRQLSYSQGDEAINEHLDKCLIQSNPTKSKQQSTLLLYAQHTSMPPPPAEGYQHLPRRGEASTANDFSQTGKTAAAVATDQHPTPKNNTSSSLDDKDLEELSPWPSTTPPSLSSRDNATTRDASGGPSQKMPSQMPLPPSSLDDSRQQSPLCFGSFIVGRQFQPRTGAKVIPGCVLAIEAELNNPRDRNALLALSCATGTSSSRSSSRHNDTTSSVPVGHLPAAVARHLAPLIHKGAIAAEAVVQELTCSTAAGTGTGTGTEGRGSGGEKAPLPVEVRVTVIATPDGGEGGNSSGKGRGPLTGMSRRAVFAVARRAVEAAALASGLPVASGTRLCRNFEILIATVKQHDAPVLAEEEHSFLQAYESLGAAPQCLFLRLCQRRGPLFRLLSLEYADVPDALAAAAELQRAGIARVHSSPLSSLSSSSLSALRSNGEATQNRKGDSGRDERLDWELIAGTLTVPELIEVLGALGASQNGKIKARLPFSTPNRASVLAALEQTSRASASAAASVRTALLKASGPLVQLLDTALVAVTRLQRLFFLNEGHSLGQFLAVDAGAVKYPNYSLTRQTQSFASRAHLLEYEAALAHAEILSIALEDGDYDAAEAAVAPAWAALDSNAHKTSTDDDENTIEDLLKPFFMKRYCAPWVYCMMATAGVSLLERQKRYREAADRLQQLLGGWCCPGRRGGWWSRLSINLEHLGRTTDALEIAEAALADDSLGPGDRLSLQRRVLRLGKPPRRWRRPEWAAAAQREPKEVKIQGRPLGSVVGMKSRFYGFDGEQCSVEDLALQYYASAEGGGWSGVHSEGGIFGTLFGLLMWPVLFGPEVPDAFRAPFQTAPLDLDSEGFYAARSSVIEARLEMLRGASSITSLVEETWNAHRGELCRGVTWDLWSLEELQVIAECIGRRGLAGVCELLARDHGGWQGGMPDLLLWNAQRRKAKLSEVKGPRDRLSDQQRAWISALEDAGLECEVLKVVEPPEETGRAKKRRG